MWILYIRLTGNAALATIETILKYDKPMEL